MLELHQDESYDSSGAGRIIRSDQPEQCRFVAGDELMHTAWLTMVLDSTELKDLREYRDWSLKAGRTFIQFAEIAFLTWVQKNGLQG